MSNHYAEFKKRLGKEPSDEQIQRLFRVLPVFLEKGKGSVSQQNFNDTVNAFDMSDKEVDKAIARIAEEEREEQLKRKKFRSAVRIWFVVALLAGIAGGTGITVYFTAYDEVMEIRVKNEIEAYRERKDNEIADRNFQLQNKEDVLKRKIEEQDQAKQEHVKAKALYDRKIADFEKELDERASSEEVEMANTILMSMERENERWRYDVPSEHDKNRFLCLRNEARSISIRFWTDGDVTISSPFNLKFKQDQAAQIKSAALKYIKK
jgi:hypothetical protein